MSETTILALVGGAIVLGSCGQAPTESRTAAPASQPAADVGTPALWAVEALGPGGQVQKTVMVCSDQAIRIAFARSLPAVAGEPCVLIDQPAISSGRFSARCRSAGHEFEVHSDARGDLTQDFTVETVMLARNGSPQPLMQTSRFRRAGPCPADWTTGDVAPPGDTRVVNALSGATQTRSAATP